MFQPSSSGASKSQAVTTKQLSREEESFVTAIQKMYKVQDKSMIVRAVEHLRSVDQSVVEALSQLDGSVIRRSMAGNLEAERVGERVLGRLTEFVTKKSPPSASSGKPTTSLGTGPSPSEAEKRRATDVSSSVGRPPEKVPRVMGSTVARAGSRFPGPQRPPARPLFGSGSPGFMEESGQGEWMRPPAARGGMMRGGFPPMSGYRPPPRGGFGRGPYF